MTQPKIDFYRRLVAMYGEYYAKEFYKERIGEEAPHIEKEGPKIDLNLL